MFFSNIGREPIIFHILTNSQASTGPNWVNSFLKAYGIRLRIVFAVGNDTSNDKYDFFYCKYNDHASTLTPVTYQNTWMDAR